MLHTVYTSRMQQQISKLYSTLHDVNQLIRKQKLACNLESNFYHKIRRNYSLGDQMVNNNMQNSVPTVITFSLHCQNQWVTQQDWDFRKLNHLDVNRKEIFKKTSTSRNSVLTVPLILSFTWQFTFIELLQLCYKKIPMNEGFTVCLTISKFYQYKIGQFSL